MKFKYVLLFLLSSFQSLAQDQTRFRRYVEGNMYWVERKLSASTDLDYNFQIEEFYDNGNLYQRFYSLNPPTSRTPLNGNVEKYFYNGKLKAKGYYENGKQFGDHLAYYPSGNQKTASQHYFHGRISEILIKYFDSPEKVIKKKVFNFINPTKDSTITYFKNGKLESIRIQEHDPVNNYAEKIISLFDQSGKQIIQNGYGKIEEKDSTGSVTLSGSYVGGNKVGTWKEYVDGIGLYKDHYTVDGILLEGTLTRIDGTTIPYTSKEKIPAFIGGRQALYQFIATNLHYPKEAREQNLSGKVILRYTVSPLGEVSDIKVLKSVHPLLDDEAIRVVKRTNKKWEPGFQRGRAVKVFYTLPISFKSL